MRSDFSLLIFNFFGGSAYIRKYKSLSLIHALRLVKSESISKNMRS